MLVYHFLGKKHGLQALTDRRLKVSRIKDLNDPFELLGPNLADRNVRSAFSEMKNDLDKVYGLLCFSRSWKNPVMWSHYADRHQGLCLGFRVPDDLLMRVNYVKLRPSPNNLFSSRELGRQIQAMKKVLCMKFSHWQYENEMRCFVRLENIDSGGNFYFKKFSDELTLNQVIVGSETTISRKDIWDALRGDFPRIQQFKARVAFTKFEVVENRNSSLWK